MPKEITDEYIRSQTTVPAKIAAQYLGMSWWTLTGLLQEGKAPYGTAKLGRGGRWSYTIWGERLYRFHHGLDADPAAAIIAQKLEELTELLREFQAS